jgi:hypothetical protein
MPRRRQTVKSAAQRISESKAKLKGGRTKRDKRLRAAESKASDQSGPTHEAFVAWQDAQHAVAAAKPAEKADALARLKVAELEYQIENAKGMAARAEMRRQQKLPASPKKLAALEAGQTLGQASTLGTQPIDAEEKGKIKKFWRKITGRKKTQAKLKKEKREAKADAKRAEKELKALLKAQKKERKAAEKAAKETPVVPKKRYLYVTEGPPRPLSEVEEPPEGAPEHVHKAYRAEHTAATKIHIRSLSLSSKNAEKTLKKAEKALKKAKTQKKRLTAERELKRAQLEVTQAQKAIQLANANVKWHALRFKELSERRSVATRKRNIAIAEELQAASSAAGGELSRLPVPLRSAPAAEQAKYAKAHAAAYAKYVKALESDAKKADEVLKAAKKKMKTGTASEKAIAQATMSTILYSRDFLVRVAPQEQEAAVRKAARLEKITEKARAKEKKATAKPTTRKPKKAKAKKKKTAKKTIRKPKKAKAKKKKKAAVKKTKQKPKKAKAKKKKKAAVKKTKQKPKKAKAKKKAQADKETDPSRPDPGRRDAPRQEEEGIRQERGQTAP